MIVKFEQWDPGKGLENPIKHVIVDNVEKMEASLHSPLWAAQLNEDDPEEKRIKAIRSYELILMEGCKYLFDLRQVGNKGFWEFVLHRKDGSVKQILALSPVFVMNDEGKTIEKY